MKPGFLQMRWARPGPREPKEICFEHGTGCSRRDARLLYAACCPVGGIIDGKDLFDELEARGYDLTTLRFSIKLKSKNEELRSENVRSVDGV